MKTTLRKQLRAKNLEYADLQTVLTCMLWNDPGIFPALVRAIKETRDRIDEDGSVRTGEFEDRMLDLEREKK